MNKKLLFLVFFLAILQSGMAQTQEQIDAFKKASPLFTSKYYKANVWDVQRSPAYPTAASQWRLSGFAAPYDATTSGPINWGTTGSRYLSFDLVKSATGSYTDDVLGSGNKFNIVLKLYEANGTYVKDVCRYGSFMGFGDKGFLFDQDDSWGTFFANDSYAIGGAVTYTPTKGTLTKFSELTAYKYSPQLLKPTVTTTTFPYNGNPQRISIPESTEYTISGTTSATNIGTYTATITLKDKANSTWSDGTTGDVVITWYIIKASVNKPTVATKAFTYNGSTQGVNIPSNAAYNVSGASATDAGSYTATVALKDKANYQWNDGTTDDMNVSWSISAIGVEKPTVATTSFTYNGNPQGVSIPSNAAYTVTGTTSVTDAGSYTVTVALKDKANYQWSDGTTDDMNVSWSISAIGVAKPTVTNTAFTYNSNPQGVSIPENTAYNVSGVASATNAGNYTATVALKDKANYTWNDGTTTDVSVSWSISKASYNMSSAKWDYTAPFPYDGTQKTVAVTGLPSGVTVKSYLGNTATAVGTYTASATFAYDEVNYNEPTIASLNWEIEKTFTNLSIIKLWDNVLAVSNGDKYEEIRNATFRWYRNGTLLSGSQQYLRFDGAIPAGVYKVEITTKDGFTVMVTYTVAAVATITAYPNPLTVGNTLTIETGVERSTNEQVQVYNLLGTPVRATVNREATGYRISGLNASGTYLIRIAKPGETPTSIKIIVK
jgi:hypothetical protein